MKLGSLSTINNKPFYKTFSQDELSSDRAHNKKNVRFFHSKAESINNDPSKRISKPRTNQKNFDPDDVDTSNWICAICGRDNSTPIIGWYEIDGTSYCDVCGDFIQGQGPPPTDIKHAVYPICQHGRVRDGQTNPRFPWTPRTSRQDE